MSSNRGRQAETPADLPASGWMDIIWRIGCGIREERVLLVSAGATFYLLIGLIPAITAFAAVYGLFFDPNTVVKHLAALEPLLPASGLDIIRGRLQQLTNHGSGPLTIGAISGVVFAFWSASNGIKAIFDAMNVAYRETEKRSFFVRNSLALLFTLGATFTGMTLIAAVGITPALLDILELEPLLSFSLGMLRWLLLIVIMAAGLSLLYRYGPSRKSAKWRWITWGGTLASAVWVASSAGLSIYLRDFANLEAIYGSLGAVISFLLWMWVSVSIVIVGAKVNAEMEHQTTRDTTTGPPRNEGERGAVVADSTGPGVRDG